MRWFRPEDGAGVILFAPDGAIVATDAAGERWLADAAVAAMARRAVDDVLVRGAVRTQAGQWLVVRGSVLAGGGDAGTAVTIVPARTCELAPLVADGCELTRQERVVTELVAEGLATQAIARRLHVSPWTVQDHLKSIFAKVGVRSRGELVSRVFLGAGSASVKWP